MFGKYELQSEKPFANELEFTPRRFHTLLGLTRKKRDTATAIDRDSGYTRIVKQAHFPHIHLPYTTIGVQHYTCMCNE